jgi:8-oxo-dGTP diphosphatase
MEEFCEPNKGLRYMVFNYLATDYEGELLKEPPEGELLWVDRDEALTLPMQDWFKRRFPMFFVQGTFEWSFVWDEEKEETLAETMRSYA